MKLNPNIHLSFGQEIQLKSLKPEDSVELFQLVESNRNHLREFLGWLDHNKSEKDTATFISKEQQLVSRGESLTLSIRYQEKLVGLVGFHNIDPLNHSASIGYWLDQIHEGKGIMTRSVKTVIDYARYALKLHRIQILCAIENKKSQKIPESLDFKKEGTLKDAIWHYEHYFDAYIYGLILNETDKILETPRMVLRKLNEGDVDYLQCIFSDSKAMQFYPGTKSISETKDWIRKQRERYKKNGYGLWACHLKDTGEFVGQCGLVFWENINGNEEVEIGYLFVQSHWKKGLATEAAKACLNYAHKKLEKNRFISLIRPENMPSRRVAERVGMCVEKEAEVMGFNALVYAINLKDSYSE